MTTEERQCDDNALPPSAVDDDDADNDDNDNTSSSSPIAYFRDALPPQLLDALRRDAEGLACCSNFWIPRAVLEGKEPPLAAFEQAAAELAKRCLRRRRKEKKNAALHPILSIFNDDDESELVVEGAEAWCQVYEGGRGLGEFRFLKEAERGKKKAERKKKLSHKHTHTPFLFPSLSF